MPYPYEDTREAYRKYLQEGSEYDPMTGLPSYGQPPADEMSSMQGSMPWNVPPSWSESVPSMGMPMDMGAPMYSGGIDPRIAGVPFGPRMYYGEPVYDLDQQADAALQQNRLLGQMVDPAMFIQIPGSYDPYSPSMIGEQTIHVPGTPMLDFYSNADSIEGEMARAVAQGVAPQEYVREWYSKQLAATQQDLIAQGFEGETLQAALDRESERLGYQSNDLNELGTSLIQEQSENQAAQAALASHPTGGYEGGAYERFGVAPPWERYPLDTFEPEMASYAEDYARRIAEMPAQQAASAEEGIGRYANEQFLQNEQREQEEGDVADFMNTAMPQILAAIAASRGEQQLEPVAEPRIEDFQQQVPLAGSQWTQQFDQQGYQDAQQRYADYQSQAQQQPNWHWTPMQPYQNPASGPQDIMGPPSAGQGYLQPSPEYRQAQEEARLVRTAGFLAEARAAAERDFYESQGHTPMMDQLAARRAYENYLYSTPYGG